MFFLYFLLILLYKEKFIKILINEVNNNEKIDKRNFTELILYDILNYKSSIDTIVNITAKNKAIIVKKKRITCLDNCLDNQKNNNLDSYYYFFKKVIFKD